MAKKHRYQFNPISLTYEIIQVRLRDRIRKLLAFLTSGLVFSAVAVTVMFYFFPSPREKGLKRDLAEVKLQYQILNDRMEQMNKVLTDIEKRDDNMYRMIFEAEPVPSNIRNAGIGGVDRYARLEGYKNSDLLINTTKKLDKIAGRLYAQSRSFDELYKLVKQKDKLLTNIPAIQPISNRYLKYISSYFGYRIHPIFKTRIFHEGLDFTAAIGTPVYATGDGKVIEAARDIRDGYGKKVIIDHGFGYRTVYAHLNNFNVKPGQMVKRGETIGQVGNTGLSTGPHLHYEVNYNGRKVNPVFYFFNDMKPADYQELVSQSPNFEREK
ncbi:MAG: M23 family metallopeptidase [Sphingobacteriia bacterium]|nr:M23 family metallopeptidase [Sphingobacteriia bacterium]